MSESTVTADPIPGFALTKIDCADTGSAPSTGDPGTRTATIRLEREGDWAVTSITDTGDGIDPSIRKHLFEPFTTTKDGTGLGLAASFEIARAHGGDLSFVSSLGTGSTFVLKLPLAGDES